MLTLLREVIKQGALYCRNYISVSAGQMSTPSIRTENDPNVDTGSTYSITVGSASESSTVGFRTCTTENNISALTGGHEWLAVISPQEQQYYNQHVVVLFCVILFTKFENTLNYTYNVTSVYVFHIPQNIKVQLNLIFLVTNLNIDII